MPRKRTNHGKTASFNAGETGETINLEVLNLRINKKMALLFVTLLILALTGVQATAAWKTNASITGLSNKTIQPQGGKIITPSEKPTSADLKAAYATEVPASVEKSGTEVKVTAATVENYFKDRIFTADNLQKLPLFKVSCDKTSTDVSPDVVVMHALDDAFAGKKPSELNVIKVLGPNSFESYAGPTAAAALANKRKQGFCNRNGRRRRNGKRLLRRPLSSVRRYV